MTEKMQVMFEIGVDEVKATRLLKEHAAKLINAADANRVREHGQHKAHILMKDDNLILMCCGREQAIVEGARMEEGVSYLLVAYFYDGYIGQYIRHHLASSPHAIRIG